MIANITNIDQMMVLPGRETQPVSNSREVPKSRRFTVDQDQYQPKKSDTENITSYKNDIIRQNGKENVVNSNDSIQEKKSLASDTAHKNKNNNGQKDKVSKPENSSRQTSKEASVEADVSNNIDLLDINSVEKARNKKELVSIPSHDITSGKSNTVTGHAAKSEEIKLLHSTEQGQLGIKTILPENSNGQNGLKTASTEQKNVNKASDVLTAEQVVSENIKINVPANVKTKPLETELKDNGKLEITKDKNIKVNNINETKTIPESSVKEIQKHAQGNAVITKTDVNKTQEKTIPQSVNLNEDSIEKTSKLDDNTKIDQKINVSDSIKSDKKPSVKPGNISEGNHKKNAEKADFNISEQKVTEVNQSSISKNNENIPDNVLSNTEADLSGKSLGISEGKAVSGNIREHLNNDMPTEISRQISESIQNSVNRSGAEKEITVRLNPPELGRVVIKFSEQSEQVTGILEVSKSETKAQIEQALPQIIRSLSDSGIQLKKVEVVTSDTGNTSGDSLKEQSLSDHSSNYYNQENSQQRAVDYNNGGFRQWFSNKIEYQQNNRYENHYAGQASINMLV